MTPAVQSMELPRSKRATRADVARAARVSLITVTYSLNPSAKIRIGAKTRERVRAIARQLGYRSGYGRRVLAAHKAYTVGLVVPDQRALLFPMYEMIIDGATERMNADDFDPLLLSFARWDRVARVTQDGRVDAIMLLQSNLDDRFIGRAAAIGLPLVVINRGLPEGVENEHTACVYSDYGRMMADVVDEFVAIGCRRILNFSSDRGIFANRMCCEGFNAAIEKHVEGGVNGSTMSPSAEHLEQQAAGMFKGGCAWDGIFVAGSPVVGPLLRAAEAHGMRVARDFQLITTDAYPETESYSGGKPHARRERTAYLQQPRLVGAEAWRTMRALLAGEPVGKTVRVPYISQRINPETEGAP